MIAGRTYFLSLLAASLLLAPAQAAAQSDTPAKAGPPEAAPSAKDRKKTEGKLLKELDSSFRSWLEEDVVYIITPEERKSFLQLSTNEEREQFIEEFWRRRNPDPESADNTFKEEHYRRIAYANEHYTSGWEGWKTDRGRMYIMWGPPDQVTSKPGGGTYQRTEEEGGGTTQAYPFEQWRYHHLEGVGDDIILEFVDPNLSGEYHLTMDPCEKDSLGKLQGAAPTYAEINGFSQYYDRNGTNNGGTTCGFSSSGMPASFNEFQRFERMAKVSGGPTAKFPVLASMVSTRVVRDQLKFGYRFDFLRVTSDTDLVPITLEIPNRQLTFKSQDGVHSASVEVYGRVTNLGGKVIQTFEDVLQRDFPESLMHSSLQGQSVYQKAVPLRPGLYRVDLVLKDVNSAYVGTTYTSIKVPRYEEGKLETSTLVLADQIQKVPSKQVGLGQFVIGDAKVRPRVNQVFTSAESVNIYLQVYNLAVDEKTHRSNLKLDYVISRLDGPDAKEVVHQRESTGTAGHFGQQATIIRFFPLSRLDPGRYKFAVQVTDTISNQTITPASEFTVKPAPPAEAAKN